MAYETSAPSKLDGELTFTFIVALSVLYLLRGTLLEVEPKVKDPPPLPRLSRIARSHVYCLGMGSGDKRENEA